MIDPALAASRYGTEHALMAMLLRWQAGIVTDGQLGAFAEGHPMDAEKLTRILDAHQMQSVFLASGISGTVLREQEHLATFTNQAAYRARFNMVILQELIQVHLALAARKLEVMFYKGVVLSRLLYGDFTSRMTADIDILIRAEDLVPAREALLQMGYEEVYRYPDVYRRYVQGISREAMFRKRSANGQYIFVEVQWAPLPGFFGLPYNNEYFLAHRQMIPLMGAEIPVPMPDQHFLLLLIHHGIGELWRKCRHLSDLLVFTRRYRDELHWDRIDEKIHAWKMRRNVKAGIDACEMLSGYQMPLCTGYHSRSGDAQAVVDSLLRFPLLPREKKNRENLARQLLLSDDTPAKVTLLGGYLKAYLSPSLTDLQQHDFPPALFPLYYVTKRFRFLYQSKT
jgi:Uncharacterised nucleotidyltransferase